MTTPPPTTLRDIHAVPFLSSRVAQLRQAVVDGRRPLVPWIGAGLSARYGFPTWAAFIRHIAAHPSVGEPARETAARLLGDGEYDLVAEYLVRRLDRTDFARMMISSFERTPLALPDPHPLERLGATTVVTTNYDRVLESLLPHLTPVTPDTAGRSAGREEFRLIKLHGTIERAESWTLTTTDYVRHYDAHMIDVIEDVFRNHTVLFLGCSLANDMYMDCLRAIPRDERPRHYAVLAVRDDAEAEYRGKLLEQLGIYVIPYVPDPGHSFVDELVGAIKPTVEDAVRGVRASLDEPEPRLWRAEIHLRQWARARESLSQAHRDLLASAFVQWVAAVRSRRPGHTRYGAEEVAAMAATSVELNPHSQRALNAAVEAARAAGRDTAEYEAALRVLTRPRPVRWSPPRVDRRLRPIYQLYTGGQPGRALRIIGDLRRAPSGYDGDRLALFALRTALLAGDAAAAEAAWHDLSTAAPRVVHYGRALSLLHDWRFAEALTALERAEAAWREHRRGVPFILWHKALARLGLCAQTSPTRLAPAERAAHLDQALFELAGAADCYERPPAQARRLFGGGSVASELAYEPRAYNEQPKYVLLDVWTFVAKVAAGRSLDDDPADLLAATERCAAEDLLLRWCGHLLKVAAPSAGLSRAIDLEQEFYDLLAVTKSSPGLLRELATMYSLATADQTYTERIRTASPPPPLLP